MTILLSANSYYQSKKLLLKEVYFDNQNTFYCLNKYSILLVNNFFHSLKTELTHHVKFETRAQAHQAIFEYIEVFYNRQRLHSSNNYMSPVDYENYMLQKEMVA